MNQSALYWYNTTKLSTKNKEPGQSSGTATYLCSHGSAVLEYKMEFFATWWKLFAVFFCIYFKWHCQLCFYNFVFFYWDIVSLWCCVHFWCTMKWISYIHIRPLLSAPASHTPIPSILLFITILIKIVKYPYKSLGELWNLSNCHSFYSLKI